ncbi:MAG: hypothetical protein MJ246_05970 [Clostridia bacterium]|nr:hypothetical protein [Clostridia bacterium]
MNNNMAYIYTGEILIDNCDIEGSINFSLMYETLKEIISKKMGISSEAIEVCKFSGEAGRDYIKVSYKLHYTVPVCDVTNAVYRMLDAKRGFDVSSVNYKATGDRLFAITINVTAKTVDEEYWKEKFVPSAIEEEVAKVLPEDLRPTVKFNISYPVTTMANYSI